MRLDSSYLETCLQVRTSAGVGTCFFRQVGTKGAFVSAAHVLAGVRVGETIYYRSASGWNPATIMELVLHPEGDDVCAFTTEEIVWNALDAEPRLPALLPGDPVRFLGFPHGLENTYPSQIGLATPLVRHAHFSGAIIHNGRKLTVLDGFNNPGYSGGPIYADVGDGCPTLFGIVSGYRPELREKSLVYRDLGNGCEEASPGLFVKPNSGMIHAVILQSVNEVFDAITTTNAASGRPVGQS